MPDFVTQRSPTSSGGLKIDVGAPASSPTTPRRGRSRRTPRTPPSKGSVSAAIALVRKRNAKEKSPASSKSDSLKDENTVSALKVDTSSSNLEKPVEPPTSPTRPPLTPMSQSSQSPKNLSASLKANDAPNSPSDPERSPRSQAPPKMSSAVSTPERSSLKIDTSPITLGKTSDAPVSPAHLPVSPSSQSSRTSNSRSVPASSPLAPQEVQIQPRPPTTPTSNRTPTSYRSPRWSTKSATGSPREQFFFNVVQPKSSPKSAVSSGNKSTSSSTSDKFFFNVFGSRTAASFSPKGSTNQGEAPVSPFGNASRGRSRRHAAAIIAGQKALAKSPSARASLSPRALLKNTTVQPSTADDQPTSEGIEQSVNETNVASDSEKPDAASVESVVDFILDDRSAKETVVASDPADGPSEAATESEGDFILDDRSARETVVASDPADGAATGSVRDFILENRSADSKDHDEIPEVATSYSTDIGLNELDERFVNLSVGAKVDESRLEENVESEAVSASEASFAFDNAKLSPEVTKTLGDFIDGLNQRGIEGKAEVVEAPAVSPSLSSAVESNNPEKHDVASPVVLTNASISSEAGCSEHGNSDANKGHLAVETDEENSSANPWNNPVSPDVHDDKSCTEKTVAVSSPREIDDHGDHDDHPVDDKVDETHASIPHERSEIDSNPSTSETTNETEETELDDDLSTLEATKLTPGILRSLGEFIDDLNLPQERAKTPEVVSPAFSLNEPENDVAQATEVCRPKAQGFAETSNAEAYVSDEHIVAQKVKEENDTLPLHGPQSLSDLVSSAATDTTKLERDVERALGTSIDDLNQQHSEIDDVVTESSSVALKTAASEGEFAADENAKETLVSANSAPDVMRLDTESLNGSHVEMDQGESASFDGESDFHAISSESSSTNTADDLERTAGNVDDIISIPVARNDDSNMLEKPTPWHVEVSETATGNAANEQDELASAGGFLEIFSQQQFASKSENEADGENSSTSEKERHDFVPEFNSAALSPSYVDTEKVLQSPRPTLDRDWQSSGLLYISSSDSNVPAPELESSETESQDFATPMSKPNPSFLEGERLLQIDSPEDAENEVNNALDSDRTQKESGHESFFSDETEERRRASEKEASGDVLAKESSSAEEASSVDIENVLSDAFDSLNINVSDVQALSPRSQGSRKELKVCVEETTEGMERVLSPLSVKRPERALSPGESCSGFGVERVLSPSSAKRPEKALSARDSCSALDIEQVVSPDDEAEPIVTTDSLGLECCTDVEENNETGNNNEDDASYLFNAFVLGSYTEISLDPMLADPSTMDSVNEDQNIERFLKNSEEPLTNDEQKAKTTRVLSPTEVSAMGIERVLSPEEANSAGVPLSVGGDQSKSSGETRPSRVFNNIVLGSYSDISLDPLMADPSTMESVDEDENIERFLAKTFTLPEGTTKEELVKLNYYISGVGNLLKSGSGTEQREDLVKSAIKDGMPKEFVEEMIEELLTASDKFDTTKSNEELFPNPTLSGPDENILESEGEEIDEHVKLFLAEKTHDEKQREGTPVGLTADSTMVDVEADEEAVEVHLDISHAQSTATDEVCEQDVDDEVTRAWWDDADLISEGSGARIMRDLQFLEKNQKSTAKSRTPKSRTPKSLVKHKEPVAPEENIDANAKYAPKGEEGWTAKSEAAVRDDSTFGATLSTDIISSQGSALTDAAHKKLELDSSSESSDTNSTYDAPPRIGGTAAANVIARHGRRRRLHHGKPQWKLSYKERTKNHPGYFDVHVYSLYETSMVVSTPHRLDEEPWEHREVQQRFLHEQSVGMSKNWFGTLMRKRGNDKYREPVTRPRSMEVPMSHLPERDWSEQWFTTWQSRKLGNIVAQSDSSSCSTGGIYSYETSYPSSNDDAHTGSVLSGSLLSGSVYSDSIFTRETRSTKWTVDGDEETEGDSESWDEDDEDEAPECGHIVNVKQKIGERVSRVHPNYTSSLRRSRWRKKYFPRGAFPY